MSGDLSSYGGLKTALADYTGRTNAVFLANRPIFVLRAHATLMRELDIPMLQASTDFIIDSERVTAPPSFRAVKRLFIDDDWYNPLSPTSMELRVKEVVSYTASRPRKFSIEEDKICFGPTPDQTYTGKLLYRKALDFFANDAATNALLARHPFAYLYGALAEAARYDKSDEDMATFEAMFQNEKAEIEAAERRATLDGGTLQAVASGAVV